MRKDFNKLLTHPHSSDEDWDDETQEAYEKTISYVGSIQKSIDGGEPVYVLGRRIQVFALVIPEKFVQMLREYRPRALVILAHFFGAVAQVEGVWWLGENSASSKATAIREIEAISNVIPPEWNGHMIWPLDKAGLAPPL
jgi:hypothetical protein